MEKDFYLQVKLDYGMSVTAESEEQAREIVKSIFEEQHNIVLEDHEIVSDFSNDLGDFLDRQVEIWDDLETVEQELLSGNETLVEWLQEELMTIYNLYKGVKK